MKLKIPMNLKLVLVLILILMMSACNNKKAEIELNTKITIDITEINKYLSNLIEFHPDRQVEIYNIISPVSGKPAIALYVYRKWERQPIDFIIESPKYEKAIYEWVNDSTLSFKLFNTTNQFSSHFTYWTRGTGSSLRRDSVNNVPLN